MLCAGYGDAERARWEGSQELDGGNGRTRNNPENINHFWPIRHRLHFVRSPNLHGSSRLQTFADSSSVFVSSSTPRAVMFSVVYVPTSRGSRSCHTNEVCSHCRRVSGATR